MSMRYRGGYISATLPTVTGQQSTPGAWTLTQQMQYQAAGTWPEQLPATWATSGTISSSYTVSPDLAFKTLQDSSGNSYFLSGAPANAAYIAKFNPDGTKAWENSYGLFVGGSGNAGAYFQDGVFDSDGNLILVFNNRVFSNWTIGLAKISPSGSVISIKSYDFGGGGIYITSACGGNIAIDAAGDVYIVGTANISSQWRGVVLKASGSTLNVLWCIGTYGYTGTNQGDFAYGVAVTPDGNSVYVSGYAQGSSSGTRFAYISRLSASSGTLLNSYQMTISGQGSFTSGPIAIDASGNIYITGRTNSNNYFFGKLNSSLTPQWGFSSAISVGNTNPNLGVSIGADGDIYFQTWGGSTLNSVPGGARQWPILLARVTPAGSLVYTRNTSSYSSVSVPSTGQKVIYLAIAGSNTTQYQRMPASGDGVSLYSNPAGNYYYNYGFGLALGGATLSITSTSQLSANLSPSTYTYSGVSPSAISSTYTLTTFTSPRIPGSALYTLPGTYSWIAPTGVTSVSALAIGGGGGGGGYPSGSGGGGGGLGYSNSVSVTPGTAYTVVVGAGGAGGVSQYGSGGAGGTSSFINASTVAGNGGSAGASGGGTASGGSRVGSGGGGGGSGAASGGGGGGGGGGAGGYAGNGGNGGSNGANGATGAGGGGGGGAGGTFYNYNYCGGIVDQGYSAGQNGGTVGIAGQGSNGAINAGSGSVSAPFGFGFGGGGGGVYQTFYPCCGGVSTTYENGGEGRNGAVRIVWGTGRSFPSTSVGAP